MIDVYDLKGGDAVVARTGLEGTIMGKSKHINGCYEVLVIGGHGREAVRPEDITHVNGQPVGQEWNGAGAPPAGAEVEYSLKEESPQAWYPARVKYRGREGVVADCFPGGACLEQWLPYSSTHFRPCLTRKQRQREELVNHINSAGTTFLPDIADAILEKYTLTEREK